MSADERALATARRAFERFADGWATGDFRPYVDMLAEEMEFWFPSGEHRGQYAGREGRARMVAKCRGHQRARDRLTFAPPHRVTGAEQTVMFEFEAEGTIGGRPYRGRIAISLDVSGDRVTGFREYDGDVEA